MQFQNWLILGFFLIQTSGCNNHQLNNPCASYKRDYLQVASFGQDNPKFDPTGWLIDLGSAAHTKKRDVEAVSDYVKASNEISKMNISNWSTFSRPHERAMQLAAALWLSGNQKSAQNVWKILQPHDFSNSTSRLIVAELKDGDYRAVFKNIRTHLDDEPNLSQYLGSGASELMSFDDTELKKALDAGALGRFSEAYTRSQSYLDKCYGPDHITSLVGAIALIAQGKSEDNWMPLLLESSVSPYVPSTDMESVDQVFSLDAEILSQIDKIKSH